MPNHSSKKPHPVDVHVGKRLRLRRSTLGMSQDDLGKQVGITFQQIQKYERGTNRISASRIWEFARILNVPEDYFFEGLEGSNASGDSGHQLLDSKESQKLIKAYYDIPELEVRHKIRNLIKAIVEAENPKGGDE